MGAGGRSEGANDRPFEAVSSAEKRKLVSRKKKKKKGGVGWGCWEGLEQSRHLTSVQPEWLETPALPPRPVSCAQWVL